MSRHELFGRVITVFRCISHGMARRFRAVSDRMNGVSNSVPGIFARRLGVRLELMRAACEARVSQWSGECQHGHNE